MFWICQTGGCSKATSTEVDKQSRFQEGNIHVGSQELEQERIHGNYKHIDTESVSYGQVRVYRESILARGTTICDLTTYHSTGQGTAVPLKPPSSIELLCTAVSG